MTAGGESMKIRVPTLKNSHCVKKGMQLLVYEPGTAVARCPEAPAGDASEPAKKAVAKRGSSDPTPPAKKLKK